LYHAVRLQILSFQITNNNLLDIYPDVYDYLAFFSGCCRLPNLQNNGDTISRIESWVTVRDEPTASPIVTALFLVMPIPKDTIVTYYIPVIDPLGNYLYFDLASSDMMGALDTDYTEEQPPGTILQL
jgi:hypothetical protein